MANLGLCIPLENLPAVFEEIKRILTPKGRVEIIDDQLFFPHAAGPIPSKTSSIKSRSRNGRKHTQGPGKDESGFFDSDEEDESSDGSSTLYTDDDLDAGELTPTLDIDRRKMSLPFASDENVSTPNAPPKGSAVVVPEHTDGPVLSSEAKINPDGRPLDMPRYGYCPIAWARYIAFNQLDVFRDHMIRDPPFENEETRKIFLLQVYEAVQRSHQDLREIGQSPDPFPESGRLLSTSVHDPDEWKTRLNSSQSLERIFLHMLKDQFGIHHQPHELLSEALESAFSEVTKSPAMHIALAPTDYEDVERLASPAVAESDPEKKWIWTKKDGAVNRSSAETLVSALPDVISSKAAKQLGLTQDPVPTGVSETSDSAAEVPHIPDVVPLEVTGTTTERDILMPEEDSSRASTPEVPVRTWEESGGCEECLCNLGHHWTIKDAADAKEDKGVKEKRRRESWEARANREGWAPKALGTLDYVQEVIPTQSPGVIVWPSRFIPSNPIEVEHLACKNINVLLGCRSALQKYTTNLKDEDGTQLMSDTEFDDEIWDYDT